MHVLSVVMVAKLLTGAAGWEFQHETNDGVKVFTRAKAGTEVKEVQAIGMIEMPPARVYKVLLDLDNYKDFMPYTKPTAIACQIFFARCASAAKTSATIRRR